jgi:hypothetical protein
MVDPTVVFDHERHWDWVAEDEGLNGLRPANQSCAVCHTPGLARTAATAKPCLECHDDDAWLDEPDHADLARAPSFLEAMHGTCVPCHQEEAAKGDRPHLGDCATCHDLASPPPTPADPATTVAATPPRRR